MTLKLVAYYRVSTAKQGASGLGLEAQREIVNRYAASVGGLVIHEVTEVETGKRADRPELAKAILASKRGKATLVIAKLDRLARNVYFVSGLMESGVDFVACDNPAASRLTIHILAAVAEDEARLTSERTKQALAAYKARGGLLGAARPGFTGHLADEAREKGRTVAARVNSEKAREAYEDVIPTIEEMRQQGRTLREIAAELTSRGYQTRSGKEWNHVQVSRLLSRMA